MFDPVLSQHALLSHLPPPGRVAAARSGAHALHAASAQAWSPGHAADEGAQLRMGVRA
jgi:hypothetical protein